MNRKLLMIPGPSEAEPQALAMFMEPVLPHYGKEWNRHYMDILEKAKKVFKTSNQAIILPGPGTAGLEMAAANLIESGDKVAVVLNGFFGDLLKSVVEAYGGIVVPIEVEYGKALDPKLVEQTLEAGDIKALFVVHNETSTGVINPVKELATVARKHGAPVVVDAISSFGGMELDVDGWGIDFCVGYASKALGGVAGATPIAIADSVWETAMKRRKPIPGKLLNLVAWKESFELWGRIGHPYPTSMPTSVIRAMGKALDLALEEGLEKRYARHKRSAMAFRATCKAIGLSIFPEEGIESDTVTVVNIPDSLNGRIRDMMENKYSIVISLGLGRLEDKVLRIGHMGVTANYGPIIQTLAALEGCLSDLGFLHNGGEGLEIAVEILKSGL